MLPLVYRGERLGEMRVGPRTPGEPVWPGRPGLLDQLANETCALVYVLRRDNELQSTRRQAMETVAEERARLGRDLHDGIAPLLAGAGLTAEALRKGMAPGTPRRARCRATSLPATERRNRDPTSGPRPATRASGGSRARGSAGGLHRDSEHT